MHKGYGVIDMNESLFPTIKRSIENLIEDEEGNIPAGKLLTIGTFIVLLSSILQIDAFAKHGSHSSHSSHSSTSYVRNHDNHASHSNHSSHASHGSHTSHSNTASHSNSNYSAAGDYDTPTAPSAGSIAGVHSPTSSTATNITLPKINTSVASPETTPAVSAVPTLAVPLDTPATSMQSAKPQTVPDTPVAQAMNSDDPKQ